jgi:hypothetical protein
MTGSLLDRYDTSSFTGHDVVALLGPRTGYQEWSKSSGRTGPTSA